MTVDQFRGFKKPKLLMVPYPAQGHVTPMLKLASAFHARGFDSVLVVPEFIHCRLMAASSKDAEGEVPLVAIPDGLESDGPRDFFAIEKAMENTMPLHLERLVRQLREGGGLVCVVVDLLSSWAIEVAERCGVTAAGFWPAMLATYRLIAAIPDMVRTGLISDTGCPQREECELFLPNQLPFASTSEVLPWLIGTQASRKARFKFWTRTLDRSRKLPWLLVNSFPDESYSTSIDDDDNGVDWISSSANDSCRPVVFPVGPLSKHAAPAVAKNPSFWEEDLSCLDWLDKQKPDSVVYISFGSWVSPIGESNIRNLAVALESTRRPFIWVLASAWRDGLPEEFVERVSSSTPEQGKVVSWAPQMAVLRHAAVGVYLTHCGWNSTMEAIQCRKRLLCYPVAGDQFLNCNFIVKKWKIGVKMKGFGEKEVEDGLTKVMEDGEMSRRLTRLHERTMGEEAASRVAMNLTDFVHRLNEQNLSNLRDGYAFNL